MKPTSTFKIALFAGLVMTSGLATGAQAAIFVANTIAASGTIQTPGPTDIHDSKTSAPTSSTSSSLEDRSGDQAAKASSTATASAEVGAVHGSSFASAEAFATGCCTSALASGSTYAEYNDTFIMHSATLADGATVHFIADILVNGGIDASVSGQFWNANGFWRATTGLNGQGYVEGSSISGDPVNGFTHTGFDTFGHQFLGFDVVLGQAANVFVRVETTAQAAAGGFGANFSHFGVDLGHTVSWHGINGVTADGQAVTDFTAVSPDTGFNFVTGYRAPGAGVPEPSTWALLIAGFGGVGAMMRRRRPALAA